MHTDADVDQRTREQLLGLVRGGNITVLTGAGMSTDSGIPGYRGPDGKRRIMPMTYGEFVASSANRQRYWARSYVGWRRFTAAVPNDGHRALVELQARGLLRAIITQNVDGLQQDAGAEDVIELHGTLDEVVCLNCGERCRRVDLDERLRLANPDFAVTGGELRPDGDVDLTDDQVSGFRLARCLVCNSDLLKPDVVFFGESVPKPLVQRCFHAVEESSGLLVLGSSLAVMSGYRFVRRASHLGLPIAVVTHGWTRGEAEATIRLDAPLAPTLRGLVDAL